MELSGKIIAILPVQSGVSQKTGNSWMSQQYVIQTSDKYRRKMVFGLFGEDRIKQADIKLYDEVNVAFDIDAHEYNGRWFNEIRAYSVVHLDKTQPKLQATQQPVPPIQPMFDDTRGSEKTDDLPFNSWGVAQ